MFESTVSKRMTGIVTLKNIVACCLFALLALRALVFVPAPFARAAVSSSCGAPEYHRFDFWIGDWDTFNYSTFARDGYVRVQSILGGCVIQEDYQSVDGHRGKSFTIYDASRKVWHQTWVTDRGRLLVIEGKFRAGAMVLEGEDRTAYGQKREVRGIWRPTKGGVRETAFTSMDGGKTWKLWFDLTFRPPTDSRR
jgi:hypothetical protein